MKHEKTGDGGHEAVLRTGIRGRRSWKLPRISPQLGVDFPRIRQHTSDPTTAQPESRIRSCTPRRCHLGASQQPPTLRSPIKRKPPPSCPESFFFSPHGFRTTPTPPDNPTPRLYLSRGCWLESFPFCRHVCCPSTHPPPRRNLLTDPPFAIRSNFTTVFPDPTAYWAAYENVAELNVHFNVFERLWAAWYQYMDNDTLATGTPIPTIPSATSTGPVDTL